MMEIEVQEIINRHPQDFQRMMDGENYYNTPLFEELYEYFCNSGEMPYGVMKARTGDPDQWIFDKLEDLDLLN